MDSGLIFVGILFGALFGAALLARAWIARNRLAAGAGLLLLAAAVVGALIVLSWSASAGAANAIELAELGLTMAAGPLMLMITAQLLHVRVPAWLPTATAAAGFAVLAALDLRYGGDPVVFAVPIQVGFTGWAWILWVVSVRAHVGIRRRSRPWKQRRLALWLLIGTSAANAASLTRLAFPDVPALRPLVPWTISALFLVLLAAILWAFLEPRMPVLAKAPGEGTESDRLASHAADLIVREGLFRDPHLGIELVAARLGVPAARLAEACAAGKWGGFAAMLQVTRLDQARSMLADPGERNTSVEAIGLLCGFRSRSAFYEGFMRRFATSPGTCRQRSR